MPSGIVTTKLILASGSPRRQEFFRDLGLDFTVRVAEIDESPTIDERPVNLAERLAQAKAAAVGGELNDGRHAYIVVAADTVVALDEEILGKPLDKADATTMLQRLRGRTHSVITGLSLFASQSGRQCTTSNCTEVHMRWYSDPEIEAYVASGDPMDKAGAYGIQHPEFVPVESLSGCLSGVMGLPLGDLVRLLAEFGVEVAVDVSTLCELHSSFRCCQRSQANYSL